MQVAHALTASMTDLVQDRSKGPEFERDLRLLITKGLELAGREYPELSTHVTRLIDLCLASQPSAATAGLVDAVCMLLMGAEGTQSASVARIVKELVERDRCDASLLRYGIRARRSDDCYHFVPLIEVHQPVTAGAPPIAVNLRTCRECQTHARIELYTTGNDLTDRTTDCDLRLAAVVDLEPLALPLGTNVSVSVARVGSTGLQLCLTIPSHSFVWRLEDSLGFESLAVPLDLVASGQPREAAKPIYATLVDVVGKCREFLKVNGDVLPSDEAGHLKKWVERATDLLDRGDLESVSLATELLVEDLRAAGKSGLLFLLSGLVETTDVDGTGRAEFQSLFPGLLEEEGTELRTVVMAKQASLVALAGGRISKVGAAFSALLLAVTSDRTVFEEARKLAVLLQPDPTYLAPIQYAEKQVGDTKLATRVESLFADIRTLQRRYSLNLKRMSADLSANYLGAEVTNEKAIARAETGVVVPNGSWQGDAPARPARATPVQPTLAPDADILLVVPS